MSEAQANKVEAEDLDFEVQVEDDTPPEDRGRTPLPQEESMAR